MNLQSQETFKKILNKIRNEEELSFLLKKAFQNDKKMVLEACQLSKFAIFYIGEKLLNDKEFILKLIDVDLIDETLYDLLSKNLQADKDIVIKFIKSGKFYNYQDYLIKNNLNNNPDVIRIAIKNNSDAIKCIGDELRNNLNYMLDLVKEKLVKEDDIPEGYGSNYLRFFSRVYQLDKTMFENDKETRKVKQYLSNIFLNKTLTKKMKSDLSKFYAEKNAESDYRPDKIKKLNEHSLMLSSLIYSTQKELLNKKKKNLKTINWTDAKKELSLFN